MASEANVCHPLSLGTGEWQIATVCTTILESGHGSYFLRHLFPFNFHTALKTPLSTLSVGAPTFTYSTQKKMHNKADDLSIRSHKDNCYSYTAYKVNKLPENSGPSAKNLFKLLEEQGIETETIPYELDKTKRPTHDDSVYCKNLFLKDRRGQFYVVVCKEDEKINLKTLKTALGAYRNFSFGSEAEVESILGVKAGGITPLALMNDSAAGVKMAVFEGLTSMRNLRFHPLDAEYATRMSFKDLSKFLNSFGINIQIIK